LEKLDIPASLDDFTPEWLTRALKASGTLQGAVVQQVTTELLSEGQGFVGQVARCDLSYDRTADGAPASVVVKFSNPDPELRVRLVPFYQRELRFYQDEADQTGLHTPRFFYGDLEKAWISAGLSALTDSPSSLPSSWSGPGLTSTSRIPGEAS
jgi:hypothetical protein